jgi:hypothetical protein
VEGLLRAGHLHVVDVDIKGYFDMVVLCRSLEEAQKALAAIKEWMAEAGLALHPEKTRLVDMTTAGSHFDFLGYRFKQSQRGKIIRLAAGQEIFCKFQIWVRSVEFMLR